jgi:hypothetical protein
MPMKNPYSEPNPHRAHVASRFATTLTQYDVVLFWMILVIVGVCVGHDSESINIRVFDTPPIPELAFDMSDVG